MKEYEVKMKYKVVNVREVTKHDRDKKPFPFYKVMEYEVQVDGTTHYIEILPEDIDKAAEIIESEISKRFAPLKK